MKKIVIAIDSFKGSVSSKEAAQACAKGIHRIFPECETICIPVADGGEGTVTALVEATKGSYIHCQAHDALMRPVHCVYGVLGDGETVVIELAAASGLQRLRPTEYDPMEATTYGTGELICDALKRGYRNFLIGLGGSATNDAGMGILQALGISFTYQQTEKEDRGGKMLRLLASVDQTGVSEAVLQSRFALLCDVTNPFYGPQGAVAVFAPQKGANEETMKKLEEGMEQFSQLIYKTTGKVLNDIPGSGAAGGTAGGLLAFLPAQIKPGIATILETLSFRNQIVDTDLVITGEGKLDIQTLHGKVPLGILKAAKEAHVPVVALGGSVEDVEELNQVGFLGVFSIQPAPVPLSLAMDKEYTLRNIEQTTSQCIRLFSANHPEKGNIL